MQIESVRLKKERSRREQKEEKKWRRIENKGSMRSSKKRRE